MILSAVTVLLSESSFVFAQERESAVPSSDSDNPITRLFKNNSLKDLFDRRQDSKNSSKDSTKDDGFLKSLLDNPRLKDLTSSNSSLLDRVSKTLQGDAKRQLNKEVGHDLDREIRRHSTRNSTSDSGVFDRIRGFLDEARNGKPDPGNDEGILKKLFSRTRGKDSESGSQTGNRRNMGDTLMAILGRNKRQAKDDDENKSEKPSSSPTTIDDVVDQIKRNMKDPDSVDRKKDGKKNAISAVTDDLMTMMGSMTRMITDKMDETRKTLKTRRQSMGSRHHLDEIAHESLRERRRRRRPNGCSSGNDDVTPKSEKTPETEKEGSDKPTKKNKRHYDEYDYFDDHEFEDYGDHDGHH